MSTGETSVAPRRALLWRRAVKTVAIAFGLLAVGFAGFRWYAARGAEAAVQSVRAAGEPTTFAELDAWYETLEGDTQATTAVLEACALLRRLDLDCEPGSGVAGVPFRYCVDDPLSAAGDALPDDVRRRSLDHLRDNAEGLARLKAAGRPRLLRYPICWQRDAEKPPDLLFPHVRPLHNAVEILCLEAVVCADAGRGEDFGAAIGVGLGLVNSAASDPTSWGASYRRAGEKSILEALAWCLSRVPLRDDVLVGLSSALSETENLEGLRRSVIVSRCEMIRMFRQSPAEVGAETCILSVTGDADREFDQMLWWHRALGVWDVDFWWGVERMTELEGLCRKPYPARLDVVKAWAQVMKDVPRWRRLGTMWLGGEQGEVVSDASALARRRAARAGLAVERWRSARGALPVALSDLVPAYLSEVPQDPFDGRALRYAPLARGFRVWSLGPDGVDGAGPGGDDDDLSFRVAR